MSKLSIYLLFGLLFVPSIVFAAYTKCYVLQGGTVCLNATTISSPYGNITMNSTANNYPTNLTVNQTGSSYSVVLGRFGLGSLMGNFSVSGTGSGIGYVNTTGASFNSTNWFIRMINDTTAQAAGVSCNAGDAISTLSNNSVCTSFITPAALSAFGYISSAPNVNVTNYTGSGSTTSIYLSNGTIYNATVTGGSGTGNATANGTANYVARFTNGTNIGTGSIYDNGTNLLYISGVQTMWFYGHNNTSDNRSAVFNLNNINTNDDGTGARNRIEFTFYPSNTTTANDRALSIQTHNNFSQHKEVSFYSSLENNSYGSKAFQWNWGSDGDGILQFIDLNRLNFPESYNGFFGNESGQEAGILSDDSDFTVFLDANNDSSGEQFTIKKNGDGTEVILAINENAELFPTSSNKLSVRGTDNVLTLTNSTGRARLGLNTEATTSGQSSLLFMRGGVNKWQLGMDRFNNGTNDFFLFDSNNSADLLYVSSNDTIGIGTTSPSSKLTVVGGANITGKMYVDSIDVAGSINVTSAVYADRLVTGQDDGLRVLRSGVENIILYQNSSDVLILQNPNNNNILFKANSQNKGIIESGGNWGINNTDPNSTLHVVGDSNVTGTTYTSVLFVNNTQVCLQNGTNCPAGGSGNVTATNGTAGYVGVFSSASNLVAMLINSTMIGDAVVNATHLYTSNGGSAGQVLTLNSTGGLNWSSDNDVSYINYVQLTDPGNSISGAATVAASSFANSTIFARIFEVGKNEIIKLNTIYLYVTVTNAAIKPNVGIYNCTSGGVNCSTSYLMWNSSVTAPNTTFTGFWNYTNTTGCWELGEGTYAIAMTAACGATCTTANMRGASFTGTMPFSNTTIFNVTTGSGGVLPNNLSTTSHLHRRAALQPYIWLATTGNASGGCT